MALQIAIMEARLKQMAKDEVTMKDNLANLKRNRKALQDHMKSVKEIPHKQAGGEFLLTKPRKSEKE